MQVDITEIGDISIDLPKKFQKWLFLEIPNFSVFHLLNIKVEVIEIGYDQGILAFFSNFSHNRSHNTNEIHRYWVCSIPSFYELH